MLGNTEEAARLHEQAPTYIERTYGGRVLSVEQVFIFSLFLSLFFLFFSLNCLQF